MREARSPRGAGRGGINGTAAAPLGAGLTTAPKAKQKAIQTAQEGPGTPDITLSELLRPLNHLASFPQSRCVYKTDSR